MNKEIENIYFDTSHPAGFGSYTTLRKYLPKETKNEEIKNFLQSQESYTLHAPARKKFKRDFVFSTNIDDFWHIDLADMQKYKNENEGVTFILVAIDVLSKFAFVRCLRSKSAENVKNALKHIFEKSNRKPDKIYSDKGAEIRNSIVLNFLKKK